MLKAWRGIRTRAGRSAAILLAAALAAGLLGATEVGACQPPPEGTFPDSRDLLLSGDGAFIGVLESQGWTDEGYIFTFRVLETIKGSFADTVEVTAADYYCPRPPYLPVGDERGVVVDEHSEGWIVYNYEQFRNPDALRRAAMPLPELVDDEPVAVAGASLGDIRSVSIAQSGAPVGYGRGDGNVSLIDVCPGGRRAVEIYPRSENYGTYWLTVRTLPSMRLVSERRVPVEVDALRCASDYARRIFVWGWRTNYRGDSPVVLGLNAGEFHLVAQTPGAGDTLTFSATHAFFSPNRCGCIGPALSGSRSIVAVDLRSGEKDSVFRFAGSYISRLAVSPNGRHLVALVRSLRPGGRVSTRDTHAVIINADTHTFISRTRLVRERGRASPEWANNRRIVLSYPAIGRLEVFDRRLHSRNVVEGWPAAETATHDGYIYGIGRSGPSSGKVYKTTLNSPSPVTEIFDLLAEFAFDIEAIS